MHGGGRWRAVVGVGAERVGVRAGRVHLAEALLQRLELLLELELLLLQELDFQGVVAAVAVADGAGRGVRLRLACEAEAGEATSLDRINWVTWVTNTSTRPGQRSFAFSARRFVWDRDVYQFDNTCRSVLVSKRFCPYGSGSRVP